MAVSTKASEKRCRSSRSFSFAIIDVPSMPIHLVTRISWPGFAPAVDTSRSSRTLPTPVTLITGWFTARVTSVWPPMT